MFLKKDSQSSEINYFNCFVLIFVSNVYILTELILRVDPEFAHLSGPYTTCKPMFDKGKMANLLKSYFKFFVSGPNANKC